MKIAIVEDRQEDAKSLNAMVQKYCRQSCVYVKIDQYETGEEFLGEMPEQYDAIFLDIFLNKLSGIDVARSLRTRGEGKEENQQKIIFVTISTDYGLEGFELRATHYLVKPCTQEKVQNAMERVMEDMKKKSFYITVTCRREERRIPISKILFIDYRSHAVQIHLKNETLRCYLSFAEITKKVEPYLNIRWCYRNVLVNYDKVLKIKERIFEMEDGTVLPIQ